MVGLGFFFFHKFCIQLSRLEGMQLPIIELRTCARNYKEEYVRGTQEGKEECVRGEGKGEEGRDCSR